MKTNKNLIGISVIILFFTSCVSVNQIGQLTMISNRNIDKSQNYELIRGYVGSSDDERKQSRATTIQQAIDETVQKVPGGEYIMNVRIYMVLKGSKHQYFSVDGDVWGIKQNSSNSTVTTPSGGSYYNLKEGDNVTWRYNSKYYTGVIFSMKDKKKCLVKVDESDNTISMYYEDLSKINKDIANPQQTNSSTANITPQEPDNVQLPQPTVQIKIGDKVVWQDKSDKKFYPGVVVGQGNGTWLIKDDDDGKIYPVEYSQVYSASSK